MSGLNNDWFYDDVENISIGLKVDNVLFDTQTRFQHAIVFKNGQFGRVLVLDGTVQLTEKDEFAYHEMIAHLPLNLHSDPKKVLIIGGGDGGVAREVVKKPKVQSVDLVEIDQEILDLSRKYLPFTSCGLDHPKVTIHVQDGAEFIKNVRGKYDVIITDSSDLEGENISVALFQQNYYESVKRALAPGGILCSQAMGMWVDEEMTKVIHSACTAVFKSVAVATVSVPSYLGGGNAFILCSDTPNKNFIQPIVELTEWEMEEMNLRYYTPSVHRSAFILPRRFQKIFQNSLPKQHKSTSVDHGSK